jgi:hypothetical protein
MGLSKKNVCSMISRFSPLLGYSIELVMKPKLAAMQVPAEQFRIDPHSSSSATTLLGETG